MLALSPFLLFVLLAELFLWLTGETVSIERIAAEHDKNGPPAAYMPSFIGKQFNHLHYTRMNKLRPEILVLGSSRVARFRQEMFGPEVDFYNASRTISSIGDLEDFVQVLPPHYAPKALLLAVDHWWFFRGPRERRFGDDLTRDDTRLVNAHLHAYRKLCYAIGEGQLNLRLLGQILARRDGGIRRYGFAAWKSAGLRNDGSLQAFDRSTPGNPFLHGVPKSISETVGDHPSLDLAKLARFAAALEAIHRKGTVIAGFAAPLAEMNEVAKKYPGQARFLAEYRATITKLFREHGWWFYDGSDPRDLGLDDRCMEDGNHAMETYHVALLRVMAADPAISQAFHLKPTYLGALLTDPRTTPWYPVYPNQTN
jgi:hypothetical protein